MQIRLVQPAARGKFPLVPRSVGSSLPAQVA